MLRRSLIGPILVVFVLLNVAGQVLPLYTDYLWFQEVKLVSVFTTVLGLKLLLESPAACSSRSSSTSTFGWRPVPRQATSWWSWRIRSGCPAAW